MSTATKLSYLNETKSQLKDMINYGLDDNNKITSSTTFRNYVSSIFNAFLEALRTPDTLFTNLPKITGSGSQITLNDTANAPMRIELGASELTQDGTPTPSSPQDIHTISGSNKVVVCGKNLCKLEDKNWIVNSSGVVIEMANSPVVIIPIGEQTNLTITGDYTLLDGGVTRIGLYNEYPVLGSTGVRTYTASNHTTTSISGYKYALVTFMKSSSSTSTETLQNAFQIEFGSTATEYTPYISQEANIDLDTIEYCKIGNYADRIFKNISGDTDYSNTREEGAWYIKKNIGKVVLDGTEDWYLQSINSYNIANFGKSSVINNYVGGQSNLGVISNYLSPQTSLIADTQIEGFLLNQNKLLFIRINSSTANTIEQFKTWLSSHNVNLYYAITPTYTQITGTLAEQLEYVYQKMLSYTGQTNISQVNNDLAFNISASALEDLEV